MMPAGGLLLGISESSFPRKWESRNPNAARIYRRNRNPTDPDARLRGNDGFRDYGVSGRMGNGGDCVKKTPSEAFQTAFAAFGRLELHFQAKCVVAAGAAYRL